MTYKVKIEKQVLKYIKKLGTKQEEYFKRRFNQLEKSPKGYRLLDASGNVELWELRVTSHRVYYTVEKGFIVISNIEFEGDINVSKAGNKNTQKGDIKVMKKKLNR